MSLSRKEQFGQGVSYVKFGGDWGFCRGEGGFFEGGEHGSGAEAEIDGDYVQGGIYHAAVGVVEADRHKLIEALETVANTHFGSGLDLECRNYVRKRLGVGTA